MKMRPQFFTTPKWQRGLIPLAAVVAALAAGFSYFLYPKDYSPLLIGGLVLVVIVLMGWLKIPSLAVCSALLIILLPDGLLPANIQSMLNRGLTIAAFGIWLLYSLSKPRRIVLTSTAIFMLGFMLWSLITIFWASKIDVSLSSMQKYFLRFLLFLFLIPNMIRTKKDLNYLMSTLAISGWLLALVSVYSIFSNGYNAGTRLKVLGVNENGLGVALLVSLIGVLWLALQDQSHFRRIREILSYLYLVLTIVIIGLSGSRGSAISLVITLAMFLLWKPTRRWGLLGFLVIIIGLIGMQVIFSTTLERFSETEAESLLSGRAEIWLATWNLIQLHPWTGVGIGNAPYAALPFIRLLRSVLKAESISVHNPVLAILAETGIPGLFLYLFVLSSAVWIFVKRYFMTRKKSHNISQYFPLLAAVFVGYMLSWIKGGGMETDYSYFLLLGLLEFPETVEKYWGEGHVIAIEDGSLSTLNSKESI